MRWPEGVVGRRLLALVVVVGVSLAVILAGVFVAPGSHPGPTGSGCVRSWQVAPATATPIRHLFVIVKENHAFENYFGAYPGVIGHPPNGSFPVSFNGTATVTPFPLTGTSTPSFPHDAASALEDYNNGQNNLFVAVANAAGIASPQDAVGYYTAAQLPAYYTYAQDYALGDRFFTGVLGPTYPNRVFDISAANLSGWNADTTPPSAVIDQPTILGQLTQANLSWFYDVQESLPLPVAPDWFPALTSDPCSVGRISDVSSLAAQLAAPDPPSVVLVDPSNSLSYSEHPPENVTLGEEWTTAVVNTIFESPIANSSAVLIFYDENGGYWDPVPPPMTSTGRDGFRVPFLALSPYTPPGRICSAPTDPAAVLRFIDTNWGLPYLNARVATAGNLSCYFDFSQSPRPPVILPTGVSLGAPIAAHPGPVPLAVPSRSTSPTGPAVPFGTARFPLGKAFWPLVPWALRQEAEGS